jgi:hypothetical protein
MTVQNPIVASDDSDLGASTGKGTQGNGDDSLLATLGYKQGLSASFSPAQSTHDQRHMQSSNATFRR